MGDKFGSIKKNIMLFFKGMQDATFNAEIISNVTDDEIDNFLLLTFSDALGLPLPLSYYSLELLPYMEEELSGWEIRMNNKKSVWIEKAGKLNIDP